MISRDRKRCLHALVCGLLALCLTGCAALTVDVDVYKGPLANHEDVQIEQFAALAIGAKPLLIRLRNSLQSNDTHSLKTDPAYEDGYIRCAEQNPDDCLISKPKAQRVNAILSLYEDADLLPPSVTDYVKTITKRFLDYNRKIVDYSPAEFGKQADVDVRLSRKIRKRRYQPWRTGDANKPLEEAFQDGLQAFLKVSVGQYRNVKENLGPTFRAYLNELMRDESTKKHTESLCEACGFDVEDCPKAWTAAWAEDAAENARTNPHFFRLKEEKNACMVASLATQDQQLREKLEKHLIQISDDFIAARTALESIYSNAIDGLLALNKEYEWKRTQPGWNGQSCERYETELQAFAALIARLTEPAHVAVFLRAAHEPQLAPAMDDNTELKRLSNLDVDSLGDRVTRHRFEVALSRALFLDATRIDGPPKLLTELKRGSEDFKVIPRAEITGNPCTSEPPQTDRCYAPESARRFGFTMGPIHYPGDTLKNTLATFRPLVNALGGSLGFERGRDPRGLETLIETYLQERAIGSPDADTAQTVLRSALIGFAEKMLFVANFGVLLDDTDHTSQEPVNRLPNDDGNGNWVSDASGLESIDKSYLRVIQAIGNTILVEADDEVRRDAAKDTLHDRYRGELYAANSIIGQPWTEAVSSLVEGLQADVRNYQDAMVVNRSRTISACQAVAGKNDDDRIKCAGLMTAVDDTAFRDAAQALGAPVGEVQSSTESALKKAGQPNPGEQSVLDTDNVLNGELRGQIGEISAPDKNETVAGARDTVIKALDEKLAPASPLGDEQRRQLQAAKDWLTRQTGEPFSDETLRDANSALGTLSAWVAGEADKVRKTINQRVDNQTAFVGALQELRIALTQTVTAGSDYQRYKDAADVLTEIWTEGTLLPDEEQPHSVSIFRVLTSTIDRKRSECANDPSCEDTDKYANALAIVQKRRTPSLLAKKIRPSDLTPNLEDRRAVIDQVIAELQYAYIQSVQSAGVDGGGSKNIAQALRAAKDYRSGMIYLRPASAYLRSSYPAATLQANSGAGEWQNLLGGSFVRSLPFGIGENEANRDPDAANDQSRTINRELDKQFWVNINRVQLRGGGKTNQVLVKDDVGNWYVKGYSNDTSAIINSTKNLALFNLGSKYKDDLLNRVKGGVIDPEGSTRLEKIENRFKTAYDQSTEDNRNALIAQLDRDSKGSIPKQVNAAVAGKKAIMSDDTEGDDLQLAPKVDEFAESFDDVVANLKDASPEKNKNREPQDIKDPGQAIVDALIALAGFRDKTIALVKDEMAVPAPTTTGAEPDAAPQDTPSDTNAADSASTAEGQIKAAEQRAQDQSDQTVELIKSIVDPVLSQQYTKRRDAVEAYRQAILFLGTALDD